MMTNQEAFNVMVRHLLLQGVPSMDADEGTCMYRGVGGRMCAVGVLLTDAEVREVGDDGSVVVADFPEHILAGLDRKFLKAVQEVHDDVSPHTWPDALRDVAVDFELEMPEDGDGYG